MTLENTGELSSPDRTNTTCSKVSSNSKSAAAEIKFELEFEIYYEKKKNCPEALVQHFKMLLPENMKYYPMDRG